MLSSEGKPLSNEAIGKQLLSSTDSQWKQGLDTAQIFRLMESILSFEVCLYHQILPLKVEDNNLQLGMVNPQDNAALNYVCRILSYTNYTILTEAIAAETHRKLLSAYLSYKNTLLNQPTSTPQQAVDDSSTSLPVLQLPPPQQPNTIETLTTLPPKKLLFELLGRVLVGGIGRLFLERRPYHGRILWSENGVLQSVIDKLPLSIFQGVLNEFKRFASLPIATVTEPQQVEKEFLYQKTRVLLRIRVMPGMHGEQATLQVLRGAALKFYQQQQLTRISRDALSISQQLNYKLRELQQRLILNKEVKSGQLEAIAALNQILYNLEHQIKALTDFSPIEEGRQEAEGRRFFNGGSETTLP